MRVSGSMETLAKGIQKEVKICKDGPWMLPEPTKVPTGLEHGEVLVIGVGGSTLRLCHVTIRKGECKSLNLLTEQIIDEIRESGDLFGWFAARLEPVLEQWKTPNGSSLPIAVSWSFPIIDGKVASMGKTFGTRYNGQNLADLFNKAFHGRYRVTSVTHDGTSSLVAGIFQNPQCAMALTLGTGVNINLNHQKRLLVNTEISMLGRKDTTPHIDLCANPLFDISDDRSQFQPFEAQVGGMYLGEMVSRAVQEPVTTPQVWEILENKSDPRYDAVNAIVFRAASLVSSAIYGLILFNGNKDEFQEVVYTGGVIFEPQFRSRLKVQLNTLAKKYPFRVSLVPQKSGSEIGAAISALTEQA